jgi:hypothetical protein
MGINHGHPFLADRPSDGIERQAGGGQLRSGKPYPCGKRCDRPCGRPRREGRIIPHARTERRDGSRNGSRIEGGVHGYGNDAFPLSPVGCCRTTYSTISANALKVAYTDTASMLTPYLRSAAAGATYATIATAALKVAYTDTASMLSLPSVLRSGRDLRYHCDRGRQAGYPCFGNQHQDGQREHTTGSGDVTISGSVAWGGHYRNAVKPD